MTVLTALSRSVAFVTVFFLPAKSKPTSQQPGAEFALGESAASTLEKAARDRYGSLKHLVQDLVLDMERFFEMDAWTKAGSIGFKTDIQVDRGEGLKELEGLGDAAVRAMADIPWDAAAETYISAVHGTVYSSASNPRSCYKSPFDSACTDFSNSLEKEWMPKSMEAILNHAAVEGGFGFGFGFHIWCGCDLLLSSGGGSGFGQGFSYDNKKYSGHFGGGGGLQVFNGTKMLMSIGAGGGRQLNSKERCSAAVDKDQVVPREVRTMRQASDELLSWKVKSCPFGNLSIEGGGGGGEGWTVSIPGKPPVRFGSGFNFRFLSNFAPPTKHCGHGGSGGGVAGPGGDDAMWQALNKEMNTCQSRCPKKDYITCVCPCQKSAYLNHNQSWASQMSCSVAESEMRSIMV